MIYHFNVHDGTAYPDALGTECATLQDARVEAVRRIGRLLAEEAARFWTGDEWTMDVTDPTGLNLFTLTFMATNSAATLAFPTGGQNRLP
jgi:hypothetical protein